MTRKAPVQSRRRRQRCLLVAAVAMTVALSGCYNIAVFGDVPYASSQEDDYERLLAAVDKDDITFSAHVGDIQASSTPCTDALVQKNTTWFDSLDEPLIYTPGDNEWTDCSDPLGRLSRIRQLVFRGTGTVSRGGTTRTLISQSSKGYPENARWTEGKVTYVTVHIVGSSDNKSNSSEYSARRAADIEWLQQAFASAKARGDKGIVVLAHSGLRFERAEGDKGAYESMFKALRTETQAFAGQVLYVHGDGHTYTNDYPMKTTSGQKVANFHRVEVYGDGNVRWVKIIVDDTNPSVFIVTVPPKP